MGGGGGAHPSRSVVLPSRRRIRVQRHTTRRAASDSEAMMTARRMTLATLEKKLAADTGAILTASEVLLLTRELQRHIAASFPALASELLPRADTIPWHSLETRCRQARAARDLSIRDV